MLSKDEINDGMTFILKLWDDTGAPAQWLEKLQGATAMRWYDIYRRSDWNAVRSEASQRRQRCKSSLERGPAHRISYVTIYGEG